MKSWIVALCGVVAIASIGAAQEEEAKETKPAETEATVIQKASYGIGINIGRTLKSQGLTEVDPKLLAQGIADVYAGAELKFSDDDLQAAIQAFQKELMAKQAAAMEEAKAANLKEGQEFLAKNKAKEGIKTLPSGLQYQVISEGTGESPKATDTVKTHYRGTLLDGSEFDSSYKRGEPATFPVNGVIKGWTEALQLMKPGAKWKLFIPADLAYGENPPPRSSIGPNSVLLFEIELLEVQ